MKEPIKNPAGYIPNETFSSFEELSLVYKQLQENKLFTQHLLDENKNLKKELQALKKTTAEIKKNGQYLLDDISHEIRTPLQAIVGLSNTLNDITDETTRKENITIIENSAFVLGSVISNILDLSKANSRNIKLNIRSFQPRVLIKNLETTFLYRLRNKPIEFKTEVDANLPDWVEGDEQKILHVLFILLDNAEKFTESGVIKLSVVVLKSSPDKILAGFSVEDTGERMDPENPQGHYKRIESLIKERKKLDREGSGFGLPVTKTLLKLLKGDIKIENNDIRDPMDGSVSVESKEKKGIKITGAIPLKIARQNEFSLVITTADEKLLSLLNILVAEDNEINKKIFSILLDKWNVQYTIVSNGEEAIEQISAHDFDLILMDARMPILNGFETTQIIRNMKDDKKASTPVIGISASLLSEQETIGKTVGMNYFLPKPFKPEQLKEMLMRFAIKKQKISSSFLNKDVLKVYFGNDYAAASQVFRIFIEESLPEINNWEYLLQTGHAKELFIRAHALKPVMEMIGLTSLSGKCFELEQACSSGEEDNRLVEKIKSIQEEIRHVLPLIKEQYQFINKMANKK